MSEGDRTQDREAARRDEQPAAEAGTAAAAVAITSDRARVVDREIVDRDLAQIVEEASKRAIAVERVTVAVDDQRAAAGEVYGVRVAAERDATFDLNVYVVLAAEIRTGRVDFRQRLVQIALAVDGEYRRYRVGDEGVAGHVGDVEVAGQRGVVRREMDGRLHDGVVDDLQHARRDGVVRRERGVVGEALQIDPVSGAEILDDIGRQRAAVALQGRRAGEGDVTAAHRRAGADFQRAGLDRRAACERIHAQKLYRCRCPNC